MIKPVTYRAKRIDTEDYVEGNYFTTPLTDENSGTDPSEGWFFLSGVKRHCIERDGSAYVIEPETLEIISE